MTLIGPDELPTGPDPTTRAVAKKWLQVMVKATENTGLAEDDVFCFGNAVGDSGFGNTLTLASVADDGLVRDAARNLLTALKLITAPSAGPPTGPRFTPLLVRRHKIPPIWWGKRPALAVGRNLRRHRTVWSFRAVKSMKELALPQ